MTNIDLAASYLLKATSRMRILPVLMEDENWSDVVREAQEIVELATKAILRRAGIDPPKWHDVSPIIIENLQQFPKALQQALRESAEISRSLAKEREQAFYGEEDSIPSERYSREEAEQAVHEARKVVDLCRTLVAPLP